MEFINLKSIAVVLTISLAPSIAAAELIYSSYDPGDPNQKNYVEAYRTDKPTFTLDETILDSFYGYDVIDPTINRLEWVPWGNTTGMSLNEALTAYDGYRLATDIEVTALFSGFFYNHSEAPYSDPGPTFAQRLDDARDQDGNYGIINMDPAGFYPEDDGLAFEGFSWDRVVDLNRGFGSNNREYFCLNQVRSNCTSEEFDQAVSLTNAEVYFQTTHNSEPGEKLGIATVGVDGGPVQNPLTYASISGGTIVNSTEAPFRGYALVKDISSAVPEIDIAGAGISLALLFGINAMYRERRNQRSSAQAS